MNKEISGSNFSLIVIFTEFIFIFIIFFCFLLFGINPVHHIHFNLKTLLISIPFTALLIIFNFISLHFLSKYFSFFKFLKNAYEFILPMVKDVTLFQSILLAIVSGFAEELFFRGLLQVQLGLVFASVLFGLFHIGNKKTIPYGLYSMGIGFYFGYLFHISGNLFLPILVHIFNNFLALNYMKYYYRKNFSKK